MHRTHSQRADYLLTCTGVTKGPARCAGPFVLYRQVSIPCLSGEDPPPQGRNTPPSASLTPPLHKEGEAYRGVRFAPASLAPSAAMAPGAAAPGEVAEGHRSRRETPLVGPQRGPAGAASPGGCGEQERRRRARAARRGGGHPILWRLLTVRAKAT